MTDDVVEAQRRLARNLRRLRLAHGLSQPELGRLVKTKGKLGREMDRSEISRYESVTRASHRNYPSLASRIALALALDVELSELDEAAPANEAA